MNFKSLDELVAYMHSHELTIDAFDFSHTIDNEAEIGNNAEIDDDTMDELDENIKKRTDIIESVKMSALIGSPDTLFTIADIPNNILHVTKVVAIKESCGAGNITLNESTLFLNICSSNGENTTNMDVEINHINHNIPLTIKESSKNEIIFSRNWVEENILNAE